MSFTEHGKGGVAGLLEDAVRRGFACRRCSSPYLPQNPDGLLVLAVLKAERSGELLGGLIWDVELVSKVIIDNCHLAVSNMYCRDSVDNDARVHQVQSVGCDALEAFAGAL